MKQYLLLRNNQQTGPHSFAELSSLNLRPLDLVWIEGQSTGWSYPTEVPELVPLVNFERRPLPITSAPKAVIISLPNQKSSHRAELETEYQQFEHSAHFPEVTPSYVFEELRERPAARPGKGIWGRKMNRFSGVLNLAAVFCGLVTGAFLLKKAVDDFAKPAAPTESVRAIQVLPDEAPAAPTYQNAVIKSAPANPAVVEKLPPKSARPKEIKKQVSLKANGYKTGMLGGISGLTLDVSNSSPHFINSLTVTVEYLKKNGDVVDTKSIDVSSIKPFTSRTVSVPASNRGVKIRYVVSRVSSEAYKAALRQV